MPPDPASPLQPPSDSRRFKFDVGDWVAREDSRRGWILVGKVVDADSESCTVQAKNGLRYHYEVGEDPIARVRWTGRGKWAVA
jgi:hypothetical protein